jgi:hypothetical protein
MEEEDQGVVDPDRSNTSATRIERYSMTHANIRLGVEIGIVGEGRWC